MKLQEIKELFKKIKWIYSNSKLILPSLIFIVIIGSMFSLLGVFDALVSKSLIDNAIVGNTDLVTKWLGVMILIILLNLISSPLLSIFKTKVSIKLSQSLQKRIYSHITYSTWQESSKHHSMSLLNRLTSDVGTITSTIMQVIPSIISLSVTLLASFTTLMYLAPTIAFIAVFIGPLLLIISRLFSKKLKAIYKEIQEEKVVFQTFVQETFKNLIIVKTFCLEKVNLNKLESIQKKRLGLSMKSAKLSALSGTALKLCSNLAYLTIFCWGVLNLSTGIGTYGTLMAMLQLYNKIQGPFSSLARTFPSLVETIAATERLMEIENLSLESYNLANKEICISSDVNLTSHKENKRITTTPYKVIHENNLISNKSNNNINIKLKDISFSYEENKPILKNINLDINSGDIVGLIGTSGQGKTTLIKLILSLLNISSGKITLSQNDTIEILNVNHRELISYVPQGDTLFSDTIENNLKQGNPNATMNDIINATKKACSFEFIEELSDGFNTLLGENATGISGGQAQRIAIARAFLRERPILILDEATSALDPATELKIIEEVKTLPNRPICLIITHRPLALGICNRILELKNGELKEVLKEKLELINI